MMNVAHDDRQGIQCSSEWNSQFMCVLIALLRSEATVRDARVQNDASLFGQTIAVMLPMWTTFDTYWSESRSSPTTLAG